MLFARSYRLLLAPCGLQGGVLGLVSRQAQLGRSTALDAQQAAIKHNQPDALPRAGNAAVVGHGGGMLKWDPSHCATAPLGLAPL